MVSVNESKNNLLGGQVRRFAVVGTQRSGTTLIQTALDVHPEIFCDGELFQMRKLFRKIPKRNFSGQGYRWWLGSRFDRWVGHALWRNVETRHYMDWYINNHEPHIQGFKLMWNQTERFPDTLKFIEEHDFLLLHVRRRNVLRSLISRYAARARDVHHSTTAVDTPSVVIPVNKILKALNKISCDNLNWEKLGNSFPYMRVDYEDYVENPAEQNIRMLHFLGAAEDVDIQSPLVKVTPNDLRDVVANFDELAMKLRGTEHEAMLEV